jgi:hypothetical protein
MPPSRKAQGKKPSKPKKPARDTVSDSETFPSVSSDTSSKEASEAPARSVIRDAAQTSVPPAGPPTQTLPSLPSAPTGDTGRTNRAHDINHFFDRGSKDKGTLTICKICR